MARSGGTYQPGQSGNPKGRPKGSVSADKWVFSRLLECNHERRLKKLGDVLFALAETGNIKAITLLLERTYGKAKQQVEVVAPEETVADYMARLVADEAEPKVKTARNVARSRPVQHDVAEKATVLGKAKRSYARDKGGPKDDPDSER